MISKKETKKAAEEIGKKIGKEAFLALDKIISNEIKLKIKSAARKTDFFGRKIIIESDFENAR